MELELIRLMCYGFGTTIILLLIFVSVLAGIFIKHIVEENKEDESF